MPRSIECTKVCAVTDSWSGGEKAKPFRILNVKVRPSAERAGSAAATSGTSRIPAGAGASGWLRSFAQVR